MPSPIQDPRWSQGVTDSLDTKGRTPVQELDQVAVPVVILADPTRSPWQRAWGGFSSSRNNPVASAGNHSGVLLTNPIDPNLKVEVTEIRIANTAVAARTYVLMLLNESATLAQTAAGRVALIDRPFPAVGVGGVAEPDVFLEELNTVGVGPSALAGRSLEFIQLTPNANAQCRLPLDPPVVLVGGLRPALNFQGLVVFNNTAAQACDPVTFRGRVWRGGAPVLR